MFAHSEEVCGFWGRWRGPLSFGRHRLAEGDAPRYFGNMDVVIDFILNILFIWISAPGLSGLQRAR
jgi:hypothetical protein